MKNLTEEEKKAISSLEKLAKNWPDSLWLYSASGSLCVMKKDSKGNKVMTREGGFDPDYSVSTILIENDGGDW